MLYGGWKRQKVGQLLFANYTTRCREEMQRLVTELGRICNRIKMKVWQRVK